MDEFIVLPLLLIPSPTDAEGAFTGTFVDVAKAMVGQGPAEPSRRAVADVVAAVYKDILIVAIFLGGKIRTKNRCIDSTIPNPQLRLYLRPPSPFTQRILPIRYKPVS